MQFILALDQGTTSSRAIVFDESGTIRASAHQEFPQIFPQPGWVEHDATEIWATQSGVMHEALAKANIAGSDIAAIGITNQRETTVVWERATGRPVAVVGGLVELGLKSVLEFGHVRDLLLEAGSLDALH